MESVVIIIFLLCCQGLRTDMEDTGDAVLSYIQTFTHLMD